MWWWSRLAIGRSDRSPCLFIRQERQEQCRFAVWRRKKWKFIRHLNSYLVSRKCVFFPLLLKWQVSYKGFVFPSRELAKSFIHSFYKSVGNYIVYVRAYQCAQIGKCQQEKWIMIFWPSWSISAQVFLAICEIVRWWLES